MELQATTAQCTVIALEETLVSEFAGNLHGELLLPDDSGYDEARAVWNGMIDKHPALIARCARIDHWRW